MSVLFKKKSFVFLLILIFLIAFICSPINVVHAQMQNISTTKLIDEPLYKETLFVIIVEDNTYHILVTANISKIADETLICLTATLLNPHNSSLSALATIPDLLTDHPFIGTVEAIHFHIPENYVEALVYYILPVATLVAIVAQVYLILSDISQYALNILLNQAPFVWASIPYVLYTLLRFDSNNDDTNGDYYRLGSFDLYIPYLPLWYHVQLVLEGHYYIATRKSWWEIIKCEVYITIFGYRIVLFTYYTAKFIKSRIVATPPKKPPVASFEWKPTHPTVGEEVLFTSTSFDPDGFIVAYNWWLGDGSEETQANFTHIYLNEGIYNVTLKVTDNDGLTNNITSTVIVQPRVEARLRVIPERLRVNVPIGHDAVAEFVVCETLNQTDLINVTFRVSDLKNPEGFAISAENVSFDKNGITIPRGTYINVTATFHAPVDVPFGWYNGNITVLSENGGNATIFVDIYVFGPPTANFTWSPQIPKVGESVTFDASLSLPSYGIIVSYEWSFGDGGKATGEIVSHIYNSAGTYLVTLNITDAEGLWDIEQKQIQVVQPHGPKAEFTATPETALTSQPVKFDASTSQPGWNGTHTMPISEYRWNFGDGNTTITSTPIVYYSYKTAGNYYVTLTVYAIGATPETDTITHRVTVITVPVGGYSVSLSKDTQKLKQINYMIIITLFGLALSLLKRKRK
jgi:PKD repeat protein